MLIALVGLFLESDFNPLSGRWSARKPLRGYTSILRQLTHDPLYTSCSRLCFVFSCSLHKSIATWSIINCWPFMLKEKQILNLYLPLLFYDSLFHKSVLKHKIHYVSEPPWISSSSFWKYPSSPAKWWYRIYPYVQCEQSSQHPDTYPISHINAWYTSPAIYFLYRRSRWDLRSTIQVEEIDNRCPAIILRLFGSCIQYYCPCSCSWSGFDISYHGDYYQLEQCFIHAIHGHFTVFLGAPESSLWKKNGLPYPDSS